MLLSRANTIDQNFLVLILAFLSISVLLRPVSLLLFKVFLAEYRGFPVAVKKLSPVVYTPESGRDFEREVETMRKIRHPNIVLFLGGGHLTDADGFRLPFIVMEYLQRGTLRNVSWSSFTVWQLRPSLKESGKRAVAVGHFCF